MAADPQRELNSIRSELQSIIRELNSIANGVQNDFFGVSNGICANRIREITSQCQRRLNTLYNARIREN